MKRIILAFLLASPALAQVQQGGPVYSPSTGGPILGTTTVTMTNAACNVLTGSGCTLAAPGAAAARPWYLNQTLTGTCGSSSTITYPAGQHYIISNSCGASVVMNGAVTIASGAVNVEVNDNGSGYAQVGNTGGGCTSGCTFTSSSINGVTLSTAGPSTQYLDKTGAYSTPAGGGSVSLAPSSNQTVVQPSGTTLNVNSFAATSTLNGLDPTQFVQVPRANLFTWSKALDYQSVQGQDVIIYADSLARCSQQSCPVGPALNSQRWPDIYAQNLWNAYGYGGTGAIPLIAYMLSSPVLDPSVYTLSGSYTEDCRLGPKQAGLSVNGCSVVVMTSGEVLTLNLGHPYDRLNVYCMTDSASGSLAMAIDGTGAGTACGSTTSSATAIKATSTVVSSATHTGTLTCTGTCYVYAVEGQNGITGIRVHNLAVGTAASAFWGQTPSTAFAFSDLIGPYIPLTITNLLTNDASLTGPTVPSYVTNMTAILNHQRGGGVAASSEVVMVPAVSAVSGIATYTAPILTLANSLGDAIVNVQSRWGLTYNSSDAVWSNPATDGEHPGIVGTMDEAEMMLASTIGFTPVPSSNGCTANCTFTGTTTMDGGGTEHVATVTSSATHGTYLLLNNTSSGGHSLGLSQQFDSLGHPQFGIGDYTAPVGFYMLGSVGLAGGYGYTAIPYLSTYCWSSTVSIAAQACDTGFSRDSAGVVDVGNGTQGNASGSMKMTNLTLSGLGSSTSPLCTTTGGLITNSGCAGANFASPPPIGNTTPNTGQFTSLTSNLFGGTASGSATSSINVNGGSFQSVGQYYSGSSIGDTWQWLNVMGTGATPTSTLTFTHPSGSSGYASVSMPNLNVAGLMVANVVQSTAVITTPGTFPVSIFSASGTPLPACNSSIKGEQVTVSDATSPTYMGAYTSGGAIVAAVICSYNGTTYSWLTH